MKIMVVGGGREHAIAYALSKSNKVTQIHAVPGNPGISKLGTCHSGSVEDLEYILKFVEDNNIDCDYQEVDSYIFADRIKDMDKIKKEFFGRKNIK